MTTSLLLDNSRAMLGRSMRHVLRSPDTIVTTALTPVAMMLMFVYVLGGALDAGPGRYVDYLLPGILVVTIASGIAYTAYRLFLDVSGGIVERFASMPVARTSLLWGHVLTSVLANSVSLVLVVAVGLLVGFRPEADAGQWLAVAGLLLLLTLALTWVAVIPGLTASSADGVTGFSTPLVFLPFVSSAFVPTDGMPGPLRAFAEHQPVTPVVDTLRDLLAGRSPGSEAAVAVVWLLALLVVACAVAVRLYRRKMS
ncbi:ABC transporter permease [Nocardioides marmoraquaticus]